MNKNIVIAVVVIIVLVLGGWWFYSQSQTEQIQPESPLVNVEMEVAPVQKTHEVIYTDAGYVPATLTIKTRDTVTFKNQSSGNMWTASGMHPTHMVYSGANLQAHCPDAENNDFDQCKNESPGTSWSFTFTKTGQWGYHNHANSTKFGKIVVE